MPVSEAAWDGSASRFTPEQWKRACVVDTGQGDPGAKERYKLPIKTPDGALSRVGVHNAAARINQLDVSPAQRKAAARRLVAAYRQLNEDAPPSLKTLAA